MGQARRAGDEDDWKLIGAYCFQRRRLCDVSLAAVFLHYWLSKKEDAMTVDERNVDPIQEMLKVVENFSKLKTWGFVESFRSKSKVIYDSEWCRVNLVWGGWDPVGGNSISIYYGRLYAPNDTATMVWDGEDCNVWHDLNLVLYFLDGTLPASAVSMKASHHLIDRYFEEEFLKTYHRRQPEWLMRMHMDIWDHYGVRLFELFDLRQADVWRQYRVFLKEYYDIKGRRQSITPSLDKVC